MTKSQRAMMAAAVMEGQRAKPQLPIPLPAPAKAGHLVKSEHQVNMEWVSVDDLRVDPTFQRALNRARAKQIADNFDPDALGKPFVAEVNGQFIIIDGQHRIEAVRLALGGGQLVQCEVVRGMSVREAANLFLSRNSGVQPKIIDKFLAGLAAGNADEVEIDKILREFGLRVARGSGVQCASALLKTYRHAAGAPPRPDILRRAIATMVNAWGEELHGEVLRGLGQFHRRYEGLIEQESLERALAQFPGGQLGVLAKGRDHARVLGAEVGRGVAIAVVAMYNAKRRTNKLPPLAPKG